VEEPAVNHLFVLVRMSVFRHCRAYAGEKVRIVAIGGSVTYGMGLVDGHPGWVQRLTEWVASAWPQVRHMYIGLIKRMIKPTCCPLLKGNVEVVNGAFPAINSAYMSQCLQVGLGPGCAGVVSCHRQQLFSTSSLLMSSGVLPRGGAFGDCRALLQ
jgi:hypothetical protein